MKLIKSIVVLILILNININVGAFPKPNPGVKTIKNLIITAMQPVGSTMYTYGVEDGEIQVLLRV